MYILDKLKIQIASFINDALSMDLVQAHDLVYPPDQKMGDLSLPCFVIANKIKDNPAKVAESLANGLSDKIVSLGLSRIFAIGPYLNFEIDKGTFVRAIVEEIRETGNKSGENEVGGGQRTMVEYSNVNTHKEYHVGHLRNLCFGDAVHRLMAANGFKSIPVSYINDFGIHVAKTLWAYLEYYKDQELPENKGFFLGKTYVRASQELKDKPELKEKVGEIMRAIESREGETYELWQETRQWSIAQFDKIYDDLGIRFEKTYYENETIDEGRKMAEEMVEKGILKKSEGAVIADFTEKNLGVLVVLRSDGTATYPVADLPLAMKKFNEYDLDASIYVVDIRQKLYFSQLFELMKEMGYKKPMIHLGYDFVTLPSGMMSSRSGNVITYEEFKEMLLNMIRTETKGKHVDWDEERVERVVMPLMKAIIKFEMLKIGAQQPITFDIEKAMNAQGFSAAYLLYTAARISSIIRKSGFTEEEIGKMGIIDNEEEKEKTLAIKMAKYPDAVKQAGKDFDPSVLCKYLFELAQDFNDYYHAVMILTAPEEQKKSKLALLVTIKQVLENGLGLLGIDTLEEM